MKARFDYIILGGGLAGLAFAQKFKHLNPVILESGYQFQNKHYRIYSHKKNELTMEEPVPLTTKYHSGSGDFKAEYIKKVYNKDGAVELFTHKKKLDELYNYNLQAFYSDVNLYGNMEVERIDLNSKEITGKILHSNEKFLIEYGYLINTIPLHKFCKLVRYDLFQSYKIFIQYYPVGVKVLPNNQFHPENEIILEYYSDPLIPFYRRHIEQNNIFYEYCINKPMEESFTFIQKIGKFHKVEKEKMDKLFRQLNHYDAYMVGRFASWNPDFIIEHILNETDQQIKEFKRG